MLLYSIVILTRQSLISITFRQGQFPPETPIFAKLKKIIFTQNCEKSENRRKQNSNSSEKNSAAAISSLATNLQNYLLHNFVLDYESSLFLPFCDFKESCRTGIFRRILLSQQLPHFPSLLVYLPRDKLPFLISLQSGDFIGIMRLHKFPPRIVPSHLPS